MPILRFILSLVLVIYLTACSDDAFDEPRDEAELLQDAEAALFACNFNSALDQFSKLSQSNNADAQSWLALMYFEGHGVKVDEIKAKQLWESLAEQQHTSGYRGLSYLYLTGSPASNTPVDFEKAIEFARLAADKGDDHPLATLGYYSLVGAGSVTKDGEQGHLLLSKVSDKTLPIYHEAMGNAYQYGLGVPVDLQKAQSHLDLSATCTNLNSYFSIRIFYMNAPLSDKRPAFLKALNEKAIDLALVAFQNGNHRSPAVILHNAYHYGFSVPVDLIKAQSFLDASLEANYFAAKQVQASIILRDPKLRVEKADYALSLLEQADVPHNSYAKIAKSDWLHYQYEQTGNIELAKRSKELLLTAAEQENFYAVIRLASLYLGGDVTTAPDLQTGAEYLHRAAISGVYNDNFLPAYFAVTGYGLPEAQKYIEIWLKDIGRNLNPEWQKWRKNHAELLLFMHEFNEYSDPEINPQLKALLHNSVVLDYRLNQDIMPLKCEYPAILEDINISTGRYTWKKTSACND